MQRTNHDGVAKMTGQRTAIVIGGGPAGLMAAEIIASAGYAVAVFDRMPSMGRKFLMAGRGGLNLTHGEALDAFMGRYDAGDWLAPHIAAFPPAALRDWAAKLGEPTYEGTSGRIFPRSFKASPLLRAWLLRLAAAGVTFQQKQRWTGFGEAGEAVFADSGAAERRMRADAIVLALGGASWPRLGADAAWVDILRGHGVRIAPLQPGNCGFDIAWSAHFRERFAGLPVKTMRLMLDGQSARGGMTITERGIEGGAVYALSARLRDRIGANGGALVHIDLRPDVALDVLAQRLARPRSSQSASTYLRKAGGLEPVGIGLVQEAAHRSGGLPNEPAALAALIKAVPLHLTGMAGLDRAISSAGGIEREACDARLMLKNLPGVFAAGEMLDWDAPTGGYLLQACFSTGAAAGRGAVQWLQRPELAGS